jgi:GrpB-like predicted nucleotidyltransferase (UPF0157 family)
MLKYVYKPYSSRFPRLFSESRAELIKYLPAKVEVEHVGSTAVPGLGGKGIIDIMIAVDVGTVEEAIPLIERAGYIYIPSEGAHDRRFLRKELPDEINGVCRYHVHVVEKGSDEYIRMLAFRDYLRNHPDELQQYAQIKIYAAQESNQDKETYMRIKEPVILEILAKVLSEYDLNHP